MRNPNFELRTHSWVTKVLKDSTGKKVTGVTYTNVMTGEEFEQPPGSSSLRYAINNVHLMLLSQISEPYDPVTQKGVIGKNYCYQTGAGATLFFEGRHFHPYMAAGGSTSPSTTSTSTWVSIAGRTVSSAASASARATNTALPIGYRPVPGGTPQWGKAWKAATAKWYENRHEHRRQRSVMANRYNYYDLDPTYRQCVRPALDAHDVRLQAERTQDGPIRRRHHQPHCAFDESTRLNQANARVEPWTVCPINRRTNTGAPSWAPIRARAR